MSTEAQSPSGASTAPYEFVSSSVDGPIGIVTLNRPKQLNALALPLVQELVEALEQHDANPAVRAMVVTGGPNVFAAGADVTEMADASPVDMLVVAADTARFGQPEINLGLMPGGGGTQRLTRSVGKSLAMDMILSGRMISAEEALAHGLAARVVPQDGLLAEAVKLGKQIATKAPLAVRLAKASITRGFEGRVDDGVELERDLFFLLFSTRDAHEGMHAFIEKRQAAFNGA